MPVTEKHNWLYILIVFAVIINCTGLFVTIIGPDGALYANIAKTMVIRSNYIELFSEGKDWLDKPHFPFWMTALSFKLFGITTFAYKLPALLFLLMGSYYTFLLGRLLYNKTVGLWSCLLLLTAQHIILSNNDVRAEPYLTGLLVAAVYHFYYASLKNNYWHIFFGALMAAAAVMTKGIFALIPVGAAIALPYLINRQWRQLFHWRWWVAIGLTLLFITPELYCLYYQFDRHPEKIVFGSTNISGLRFFFWDSQFGRFMNTGPIKGKGDLSFFLHTTLWAFLPWSILFFIAIVKQLRDNLKHKQGAEWLTIGAIIPAFLIFSLSKFQLPHYINILYPFFAIVVAASLLTTSGRKQYIVVIQSVLVFLLLIASILLHVLYRPDTSPYIFIGCLLVAIVLTIALTKDRLLPRHLKWGLYSALAILVVNSWLNTIFYPSLLRYQGGSMAAGVFNRHYVGKPVYFLGNTQTYPLDFYLKAPLTKLESIAALQKTPKPLLAYVSAASYDSLRQQQAPLQVIDSVANYPISKLKIKFIPPESRKELLEFYKIVYWP